MSDFFVSKKGSKRQTYVCLANMPPSCPLKIVEEGTGIVAPKCRCQHVEDMICVMWLLVHSFLAMLCEAVTIPTQLLHVILCHKLCLSLPSFTGCWQCDFCAYQNGSSKSGLCIMCQTPFSECQAIAATFRFGIGGVICVSNRAFVHL